MLLYIINTKNIKYNFSDVARMVYLTTTDIIVLNIKTPFLSSST